MQQSPLMDANKGGGMLIYANIGGYMKNDLISVEGEWNAV